MSKKDQNKGIESVEDDFNEESAASPRPPEPPQQFQKTDFDAYLKLIQNVMRPRSTAPTVTPRNFLEQFVLYESGATRRLYVWVNGTWRYATLT